MPASNESVSRVTVYKLNIAARLNLKLPEYDKVADGSVTVGKKPLKYWLYFLRSVPHPPKWYRVFQNLSLKLPKTGAPRSQTAGFVMLVNLRNRYYGVAGGIGHIALSANRIEHRFGTILAEKILSLPELRGLVQKDTSGVVNRLDRVFRGSYNPQGELDNLRRVLSSVRGRLDKKNPHYAKIGKSIQAGNALTVNGAKSFDDLFAFLVQVDKLWRTGSRQITIPQLAHIDKKFHGSLLSQLNAALIDYLVQYRPGEDIRLFLDNEEIGYLPDRVESYQLVYGHRRHPEAQTHDEVFEHVSSILAAIPSAADRATVYAKMRLRVTFDDDTDETRLLGFFVCGDIVYNNDVYFINNRLWYQADAQFLSRLDAELDNIRYADPGTMGLIPWNEARHTGKRGEYEFNRDCSKTHGQLLLDSQTVKIQNEKGGIEFCDLLLDGKPRLSLIHVKKATGAALRALFAQAHVSARLYADSPEFRDLVHTATFTGADKFKPAEKSRLKALAARLRREFRVVFAIYDDTPAHTVPVGASTTSKVLNGTLTPFAKVDLLDRVQTIRAMGYDVGVTRITPHP